jgi:hypothetical protein
MIYLLLSFVVTALIELLDEQTEIAEDFASAICY